MLPRRIPKPAKRASRWKSQAHRDWVRGFTCCVCGSSTNVEVAHVRFGSGAGMGQKPDDWRTVPLCAGPSAHVGGGEGCHTRQHRVGEQTFWKANQIDIEALIRQFIAASPRRRQIEQEMRERANGQ